MMGYLWCKLQLPVLREHRDLDPDVDLFQKKTAELWAPAVIAPLPVWWQ